MGIPKIIHQIWLGGELPRNRGEWMDSVRSWNPGWEHRFWKVEAPSGDMVSASNLLRFRRLFVEGGVYLDTDMEALGPLEGLGLEEGKIHCDGHGGLPHHAFLACEPGKEGILRILANMEQDEGGGRIRARTRVLQEWARHKGEWKIVDLTGVLHHHFEGQRERQRNDTGH